MSKVAAACASRMRAILVRSTGPPEVMKTETVDTPTVDDDEVLVKVEFAGVNPVDTYIRAGAFGTPPNMPYTPGKDGSGRVVAAGCRVDTPKVGDSVFFCSMFAKGGHGSYAEYAVVNKDEVWTIPESSKMDLAAGLGIPYLTAHRALFIRAQAQKTDKVLVHGASGAVGHAAIQMALQHGLQVIASAGTDQGLERLRKAGVEHVVNHNQPDYVKKILDTFGKIDVILEMRADLNLDKDVQMMATHGRIMVIGNRGSTQLDARHIMFPESSIMGVALATSSKDEWASSAKFVRQGFIEGNLVPHIGRIYEGLDTAPETHRDIIESVGGATGKLRIKIQTSE